MSILFDLLGKLAKMTRRSLASRVRALPDVSPSPGRTAPVPPATQQKYVWQRLNPPGIADFDASLYGANPRNDAVALLSFAPRFALDVGCSSGGVARAVMAAYPQCRLWGIEPNATAARLARSRMDRVIGDTFETINWAEEGVGVGDIDTVFLLDVLEHMYNPWRTLETLRSLVNPQAQLVISLPNVRNMFLIRDLMNGYWHYRDAGLLDSTHIRFFSEHEALRLIYQTGFRVERHSFPMCAGIAPHYEKFKDGPFPQRVEFEKGSLEIENLAELQSFAAMQHMYLVRPVRRDELSAEEIALIDGPHPQTFAMGADYAGTL